MSNTPRRYRATQVVSTIREQGRTVAWLSRKLGLSRQYTSDVVHGHIVVSEEVAMRVGDAIGVPFFLVFDVSGDTQTESPEPILEVLA